MSPLLKLLSSEVESHLHPAFGGILIDKVQHMTRQGQPSKDRFLFRNLFYKSYSLFKILINKNLLRISIQDHPFGGAFGFLP